LNLLEIFSISYSSISFPFAMPISFPQDGRIIENGSAERNATQLEMAQLREYIKSMRTYQEQLSKKFAYRMMAQVATKIQGTIIG
jgi:hypothetical protein